MPDARERHAHEVEQGLLPEVGLPWEAVTGTSLSSRMAIYRIPGVSIAVIHDGEVEWARGYGNRQAGKDSPVTADTLFQACSISKPVAAVGALRLAEAGRLDLDQDVNHYLRTWRLPANGAWQPRVTVRQLLCHGAGLTVHGFGGYAFDQPVPTLLQVLRGEPPANTPPVRMRDLPGTHFRYSGGGYCVLQQLMQDVTDTAFPELMRQLVLEPLGLRNSTYAQPLPADRRAAAAAGHRCGGGALPGHWHTYPEMAAAGLWTTPSDLAALGLHLAKVWCGSPGILRPATVREMLSPQVEGHIGLGFFLAGRDGGFHFLHEGDNEGFKCKLVVFPERGQGAVIMTNGDEGWFAFEEIFRGIARVYGWPSYLPGRRVAVLSPRRGPCGVPGRI